MRRGIQHIYLTSFVAVVGVGLLGLERRVWAEGVQARATLRGISGFEIAIPAFDADALQAGLTEFHVQGDVIQRLRTAGVHLLTEDEGRKTPGHPYLYVNITLTPSEAGLYAVSIEVAVYQVVWLERDRRMRTYAQTWSVGSTGIVAQNQCSDYVRQAVADKLDKFLQAYFVVNPKQ